MESINVYDTGMNAEACRHFISDGTYDVWYALLLCSSCGGVGEALGWAVIGILHDTFLLSIITWMNMLLLCFVVNWCDLNTYLHLASQRLKIDTSELCMRLGKLCPSNASSDKYGKSSKQGLLDWMVLPFGHPTWMGGAIFYGICEASGLLGTPVTCLLYGVLLMILLA